MYVSFGDKNYMTLQEVPAGTKPNATTPDLYWELDVTDTLKDVLGRYNENLRINDANLKEAARIVPKAGYDTSRIICCTWLWGMGSRTVLNLASTINQHRQQMFVHGCLVIIHLVVLVQSLQCVVTNTDMHHLVLEYQKK